MKHTIYTLFCLVLMTSCAEQYKIAGNSNVATLDGRMLYLKVAGDTVLHNIDSCEVVHGKFAFNGMVDSIMMAELYMDNKSVLPVVIENYDLTISVSNLEQRVSGGPLNDKLYKFIKEKSKLLNEYMELPHKRMKLMLKGKSPKEIQYIINKEAKRLSCKIECLETDFVLKNCDNVLGSSYFMYICDQYNYPILTEQIQHIITKAPASFLAHPFVANYLHIAKVNMQNLKQSELRQNVAEK